MKKQRQFKRIFLAIILLASTLSAKDNELRLRWEDLPNSLTGARVRITQTDDKTIKGSLIRLESSGLVLESGTKSSTVPRSRVRQIELRKLGRSRGRIIGVSIGAAAGIIVTAAALAYKNNENGTNSDSIVGAAVGIGLGATILGYLAGRSADGVRTTYIVVN